MSTYKLTMDQLVRKIEGGADFLRNNSSKVLKPVGQLIEIQIRRRITREKTDPQGRAWQPWDPSYARHQRAHFPNRRMLEATGAMRDSLETRIDESNMLVGVGPAAKVEYAKYVNKARRFLGLSNANRRDISELVTKILKRNLFGGA